MSFSRPSAISFGDRNLWIPVATTCLAMAEDHEKLPAAEKDFRKAIADLIVLAQNKKPCQGSSSPFTSY